MDSSPTYVSITFSSLNSFHNSGTHLTTQGLSHFSMAHPPPAHHPRLLPEPKLGGRDPTHHVSYFPCPHTSDSILICLKRVLWLVHSEYLLQ